MPRSSDITSREPLIDTVRRGRFRAIALLAALVLASGATACGSDDDRDGAGGSSDSPDTDRRTPLEEGPYLKQLNAAQTDFAGDAAKLNLANPASPEAFARSLDRLDGLVDTLRRRLDDIPSAESVASEHDELVKQLGDYGAVIRREKGDLSSGDPAKVRAAAQAIGTASTAFSRDFDATIRRINDKLGRETVTTPN